MTYRSQDTKTDWQLEIPGYLSNFRWLWQFPEYYRLFSQFLCSLEVGRGGNAWNTAVYSGLVGGVRNRWSNHVLLLMYCYNTMSQRQDQTVTDSKYLIRLLWNDNEKVIGSYGATHSLSLRNPRSNKNIQGSLSLNPVLKHISISST
jgi:hypothetical protein